MLPRKEPVESAQKRGGQGHTRTWCTGLGPHPAFHFRANSFYVGPFPREVLGAFGVISPLQPSTVGLAGSFMEAHRSDPQWLMSVMSRTLKTLRATG